MAATGSTQQGRAYTGYPKGILRDNALAGFSLFKSGELCQKHSGPKRA